MMNLNNSKTKRIIAGILAVLLALAMIIPMAVTALA